MSTTYIYGHVMSTFPDILMAYVIWCSALAVILLAGISAVYSVYKCGDKHRPWGTPKVCVIGSLNDWFGNITWKLFGLKMGNRAFINVADTPISLSSAKRRDQSMLSNALVKSTYFFYIV